jgi:ketosteroid isomerase-like protein
MGTDVQVDRRAIEYEVRDRVITVSDDVAFIHCVNRIGMKSKDGKAGEGTWLRVTVCFRKIDGQWMVTHEHVSVPFDAKSGNASMDLKPQ